jgi:hypothetical protein
MYKQQNVKPLTFSPKVRREMYATNVHVGIILERVSFAMFVISTVITSVMMQLFILGHFFMFEGTVSFDELVVAVLIFIACLAFYLIVESTISWIKSSDYRSARWDEEVRKQNFTIKDFENAKKFF